MADPIFERVALIGLGLIGSSLALAIQRGGLARHVVGHARSPKTRKIAGEIGLAERVCESAADAVSDADLVIL